MSPRCVLLMLLSVTSGKYVFVGQRMHWDEAQEYCRSEYTDLAPTSTQNDIDFLFEDAYAETRGFFWIGLMRDPENTNQWLWSGGGEVNRTFWTRGEPNNVHGREDKGSFWGFRGWNDLPYNFSLTFFCYKVHVMRERKTWEEAVDHCRTHHRDLASVASETELMLIETEVDKSADEITEHVWIGLRFLVEEWLWVDGQPLEYEAWGLGGQPWCPEEQRCAALQVTRTSPHNTTIKEWTFRSCDDELHFLCY